MKRTPPGPGARYDALIDLLRTAETLWNASRVFFDRWDLSPSQFNVLNLLYELPGGCTQIELSRRLIMHRSNMTGLVDRLESRGFLRREDSATDRRAFTVMLTPAGKKLVSTILPYYYEAAEAIWGNMSPAHATQIVAELQVVGSIAEAIAAEEVKNLV